MAQKKRIVSFVGKAVVICVLLLTLPFIWLFLLCDFARLQKIARAISCSEPDTFCDQLIEAPGVRIVRWIWDNIVRTTLEIILLPFITIVGMFLCVFEGSEQ